jgi:molecular chaperone DnaK
MHVGIDLGTTNSVLATFDGTSLAVVSNNVGEVLTPSVVRIDARGGVTVGRRAARFLETDPANTRAEFKRLMGSAEAQDFPAVGKSLLPEELSARVLSSLLADAADALAYTPRGAVISTPALFELPQNHATTKAGRLAGLEEVVLIQEPIASAIAAGWEKDTRGLWLVFDLGGGTLDVSLLETKDGFLRVVDHAGDNFLGGKDFDNALVDWSVARLKAEHPLRDFGRSSPQSRRAIGKLKAACEAAKIDLSRSERARIVVPELGDDDEGSPVEVDLEIERSAFESLVAPLVDRSLDVCLATLARHKVDAGAVERVVFVGGPTLMPVIRSRVGAALGGRVADGIDPMTIVARGAALYAATARVEARPASAAEAPGKGLPLQLEHPAVTSDLQPFVVGRFLPGRDDVLPRRVRIAREDRGFQSADVEVSPEGSFMVQVSLEPRRQNRFRVFALSAAGGEMALRSPEFAIVQGLSVADPPLSRAVGIARSDDTVHTYFDKGTPLPARRTFVLKTVAAVAAGGANDVLRIPVVQGESPRAHRNRLIGTLQIDGAALLQDLPMGSAVEISLQLDRSGQMQARAHVPAISQTFEDVVHLLVPTASVEVLRLEGDSAERRLGDVRGRCFQAATPAALRRLEGAAAMLSEARSDLEAAGGGDRDAAQRAQRLLLELNGALDAAEDDIRWPELEAEARHTVEIDLSWVAALGTPAEQKLFDEALAALEAARKGRDSAELERQLRVVRALGGAAYARDPASPARSLEWHASRLSEASDLKKAHELVARGREALARNDASLLRAVNSELSALFPGTAEERQRSFGSGVQ